MNRGKAAICLIKSRLWKGNNIRTNLMWSKVKVIHIDLWITLLSILKLTFVVYRLEI